MKPGSFIALGGCHIIGYSSVDNRSFVNVIEEKTGFTSVFKKNGFLLTKTEEIIDLIGEHHPEIILLQPGNYEFHASSKKIFEGKTAKSKTPLPNNGNFGQHHDQIIQIHGKKKGRTLYQATVLELVWWMLKRQHGQMLKLIREYIRFYPEKKFIIISPLPCLGSSDNYIRKKAAKYMNSLYSGLGNVTYINVHGKFPMSKRLFSDPFHLNSIGHKILGKYIADQIKLSFKSKFYLAAS